MTPTWRTGYTLRRQEDSSPTAVTTMALIAVGPTTVLLFSFTENSSNTHVVIMNGGLYSSLDPS